jgi:hypothetical protein
MKISYFTVILSLSWLLGLRESVYAAASSRPRHIGYIPQMPASSNSMTEPPGNHGHCAYGITR